MYNTTVRYETDENNLITHLTVNKIHDYSS